MFAPGSMSGKPKFPNEHAAWVKKMNRQRTERLAREAAEKEGRTYEPPASPPAEMSEGKSEFGSGGRKDVRFDDGEGEEQGEGERFSTGVDSTTKTTTGGDGS